MESFDEYHKKFDQRFRSAQRMAAIGGAVAIAVSIGVLGFAGWVIVVLLRHFGVL
jgi:uncharacterized membrane protein